MPNVFGLRLPPLKDLVTRFRASLLPTLAVLLMLLLVISGVLTYRFIASAASSGDNQSLMALLGLDGFLVVLFILIVTRRIRKLWLDQRQRSAGSQLHARLALLFGAFALLPAALVIAVSLAFFHYGIEAWFSTRVKTALQTSVSVAGEYLREHQRTVGSDALLMAHELRQSNPKVWGSEDDLSALLTHMTNARGLTEALIFDGNNTVYGRANFTFALEFEPMPGKSIEQAMRGDVALLTSDREDRIRALVKIKEDPLLFLYVGRFVEPEVLHHYATAQDTASDYMLLEGRRQGFEMTFALIFTLLCVLLLLIALWLGLNFATRFVQPLSALLEALERLRSGHVGVRVVEDGTIKDVRLLIRTFNRMSQQLEDQREDLKAANDQLARRQEFTEAVLRGVSSGVIGLDGAGRISLPNAAASHLLKTDIAAHLDASVDTVLPEIKTLLSAATAAPLETHRAEIELVRGPNIAHLLMSITTEWQEGQVVGYVLTFDDITTLKSAQRKAAWSDIARKIAHEIKNPLTPIQLAAERLKRKYVKMLPDDQEPFERCVETIIRQVSVIQRLVQEFSSFARMPEPRIQRINLSKLVDQTILLQREAFPDIKIREKGCAEPLWILADGEQLSQLLSNVIQNAGQILKDQPKGDVKPEIRVELEKRSAEVVLTVSDNGPGWPPHFSVAELMEPYVTQRPGGTGLGLAIVKKIAEDHGGVVYLKDAPGGGAEVQVVLPLHES